MLYHNLLYYFGGSGGILNYTTKLQKILGICKEKTKFFLRGIGSNYPPKGVTFRYSLQGGSRFATVPNEKTTDKSDGHG